LPSFKTYYFRLKYLHNFQNHIVYRVYLSEFDRQTFRVDSMIKNKHKTLNTYMGSKTLSLRDNKQKRKNNYDLNSLDFMGLSVH
jgi:hypothetical protein